MAQFATKKAENESQKSLPTWENSSAEFIPYRSLIDDTTIKFKHREYLKVIKVKGVAHEAADPEDIIVWKERLNNAFKAMDRANIAIWTHTVRRKKEAFPNGEFTEGFDNNLNEKYKKSFNETQLLVNELYISLVYRPDFSALRKKAPHRDKVKSDLEKFSMIETEILGKLELYEPRVLTTYFNKGLFFSETVEFLDFLVNGEWTPRISPRKPINETLLRSRPFWGAEAFELRGVVSTKFGASLGILEYPEQTEAGCINALLSAPFTFILSQSFTYMSKPVATEALLRQQRVMEQAGDLAISQVNDIDEALDDLTAGRIAFGHHHLSLTLLADSPAALKENVADAQAELADYGITVAREDVGLAAAYWAQLPGNFEYRPRPCTISTKNFLGFAPFHNYPTGYIKGNQWGNAVTMFRTTSGAPYYFNFHQPLDKQKNHKKRFKKETGEVENLSGQKVVGNTLIIGPAGSGKTVLQGFLMSQSKKFNPTQVIFDKDRGLEIYVRASKGVYLPLETGKATGFNPFQLEPTESNIVFLTKLVKKLAGDEKLTASEEAEIDHAVRDIMLHVNKEHRQLCRCLEYLSVPQSGNENHSVRLQKWCLDNPLSWVFDNEMDELSLTDSTMFGFDVTSFIDNDEVRTPVIMYLFHRIEELIDGRRLLIFLDEFWKLLQDKYFEKYAEDKQKVIRKQGGLMVYGTQSASDILKSKIAPSLVEQCATQIFMPNERAAHSDYVDGFQLTEREFELIHRELTPESRRFLIKKGRDSVVAELNLKGFDDELAVISGTTETVNLLAEIRNEIGDDPINWLPVFHERRAQK
jgi:type IV secretion system protein VirB4